MHSKAVVESVFSSAGITINGRNPWDIQIHDEDSTIVLWPKEVSGSGILHGRLVELRAGGRTDPQAAQGGRRPEDRNSPRMWLAWLRATLVNRQSKSRSLVVAEQHYDIGNDVFMSFLDGYNQYSCAYFRNTGDLDEAQTNKLDLICRKLNLKPGDKVLDIGFGWAAFPCIWPKNTNARSPGSIFPPNR